MDDTPPLLPLPIPKPKPTPPGCNDDDDDTDGLRTSTLELGRRLLLEFNNDDTDDKNGDGGGKLSCDSLKLCN